ncbi:MAG TPA: fumarylacetoacetate hydrolase family protein [Burkholderiaceae bacterium]|nr:fumarylacetoacetate hydrolase family protein [Burkholderiaceae bacterium]
MNSIEFNAILLALFCLGDTLMKLASFTLPGIDDVTRVGVLYAGRMLDVARFAGLVEPNQPPLPSSVKALLELGDAGLGRIPRLVGGVVEHSPHFREASHDLDAIHFLPPIPDAEKFLCVGKNYRTHLAELQRTDLIKELPNEPTGFVKLNACLTGHNTFVKRPATVSHLDYEPELVFVIGKPAFEVGEENAFDYVAGITLLNDLTCRDTQKREVASGSRFWTAKNAPGFGPLGPFIITMDEVPDPYDLWLTCAVNGEERMRVNTRDQIWKLPRIIAHFSRLLPLKPGDMFSTGAPGGVAVGKPNAEELFLKPGDVVECSFESPSMTLRNTITAD